MACQVIQDFSLPGEICSKFAIDWSQDNKISVCTSKAIYILTTPCSPLETECSLEKQVVPAPEQGMRLQPLPMPSTPYGLLRSHEDEVGMNQILLDHTLNPLVSEAFRSYRHALWSPKGAAKGGRCILAALTLDHRLLLYEEVKRHWTCICDLTEVLKEESEDIKKVLRLNALIEKRRTPSFPETKRSCEEECLASQAFSHREMMNMTYRLAPIVISWTSMFGSADGEYCFLIAGMKSGHIQFWKIAAMENRVISLVHEWDCGLGLLTTLCWQQTSPTTGFIMCGSLRGILAFIPVAVRSSESSPEPLVVVKEMCKIWDEEDSISVDKISVLKIALKKYVVLATKQHALVACEILLTDSSIIIRNVGHSFGLHKMPITGMAVLDSTMPQFQVLVSSMEGLLVHIKITVRDDEIKFQHQKVAVDLDLKDRMIQGLAVSSNGILCSVVLNTPSYFDYMTSKKEPLKFVMFATKSLEEIFSRFKAILQLSLIPSSVVRLTDYLECIRISLACGGPLPQWMDALLDSQFEHSQDLQLYTIRFLLNCCLSGLCTKNNQEEMERKLRAVETVILKKYVCRVFSRCQEKMDLLTPSQGQSLLLMADWLLREFQMPMEGLYSALGSEVPDNADALPAREECSVCKAKVPLVSLKVGHCPNGHSFARCCHSLLLCDASLYRQCKSCKSLALDDLWEFESNCTYCGLILE